MNWEEGQGHEQAPEGGVEGSLAVFRHEVEEGFGRIGSAAQHLLTVAGAIEAAGQRVDGSLEAHRALQGESQLAVEEARGMLAQMHQVSDEIRALRRETEDLRDSVSRMKGDLTSLSEDLRARIAALAILGQPLQQPSTDAEGESAPSQAYAGAA